MRERCPTSKSQMVSALGVHLADSSNGALVFVFSDDALQGPSYLTARCWRTFLETS